MTNLFQHIYDSNMSHEQKINAILGHLKSLHEETNFQREIQNDENARQRAISNFQGVSDGFRMIETLGGVSGNRGMQTVGMAGVALAQGAMGFGALTGTMGMTQVAVGGSMITPAVAVIGAVLTLHSMFGRRKGNKQAKALQKMFKQLSSQLVELHKDMFHGFNALNNNMMHGFNHMNKRFDHLEEVLIAGFTDMYRGMNHIENHIDEVNNNINIQFNDLNVFLKKSVQIILSHQEVLFDSLFECVKFLDNKLDDQNIQLGKMDEKLDLILAQLQKLGIHSEKNDRVKMIQLAERYELEHESHDFIKLLQAIQRQLVISANTMKNFSDQGNSLPGWYYIAHLSNLFKQPLFHQCQVDLNNTVNMDWAAPTFDSFIQIIRHLGVAADENHPLHRMVNSIYSDVSKSSKATADFIRVVSSSKFINNFFKYHTDRLQKIQTSAEKLLKPMRDHLSQPAMREYVKSQFSVTSNKHIEANTHSMASQLSVSSLNEINEKVKKYNKYIKEYKFQTEILLNLFDGDKKVVQAIKNKLSFLQPIHENYYQSRGVVVSKSDQTLNESIRLIRSSTQNIDITYSYLDINVENKFSICNISSQEIHDFHTGISEDSEDMIEHLDSLNVFSELNLMPTTHKQFCKIGALPTMKKVSRHENLDRILKLMEPSFKVADEAKGKSIVYIMGITGDGKSTLLNNLNGSRYCRIKVLGKPHPEWDKDSKPEVAKVGESIGRSETLFPQLVNVKAQSGECILYCDLPGLDGSRKREVTISEAYAPFILNEQVGNVQGIVWVVNVNHFDVKRADTIKEMLSNLVKVSRKNPDTIANAITIVVTKDLYGLTPDDVILNFKEVIKCIDNEEENKLLSIIIEKLSVKKDKIIVSDIYATDNVKVNAINESVLNSKVQDKNLFDFTEYCSEQKSFVDSLKKILEERNECMSEYESGKRSLENSISLINEMQLSKERSVLLSKEYQRRLDKLKQQKEVLIHLSQSCQSEIDAVNNCIEPVIISKINHHIPPETQERVIKVDTGLTERRDTGQTTNTHIRTDQVTETRKVHVDTLVANYPVPRRGVPRYKSPNHPGMQAFLTNKRNEGYSVSTHTHPINGRVRYTATKEIYKNELFTYSKEIYEPRPVYTNVPILRDQTIVEPLPSGNTSTWIISHSADHPVNAQIENSTGWTIMPGTLQNNAGYHATVQYERGVGCDIKMYLTVARKDSPEGRLTIEAHQSEKYEIDREILAVTSQIENLQSDIGRHTAVHSQLEAQLREIINHKDKLQESVQEMDVYFKENKSYLESLDKMMVVISQSKTCLPSVVNHHASMYGSTASSSHSSNNNNVDHLEQTRFGLE